MLFTKYLYPVFLLLCISTVCTAVYDFALFYGLALLWSGCQEPSLCTVGVGVQISTLSSFCCLRCCSFPSFSSPSIVGVKSSFSVLMFMTLLCSELSWALSGVGVKSSFCTTVYDVALFYRWALLWSGFKRALCTAVYDIFLFYRWALFGVGVLRALSFSLSLSVLLPLCGEPVNGGTSWSSEHNRNTTSSSHLHTHC